MSFLSAVLASPCHVVTISQYKIGFIEVKMHECCLPYSQKNISTSLHLEGCNGYSKTTAISVQIHTSIYLKFGFFSTLRVNCNQDLNQPGWPSPKESSSKSSCWGQPGSRTSFFDKESVLTRLNEKTQRSQLESSHEQERECRKTSPRLTAES